MRCPAAAFGDLGHAQVVIHGQPLLGAQAPAHVIRLVGTGHLPDFVQEIVQALLAAGGVTALLGGAQGFPCLPAPGLVRNLQEVVDAAFAQVAVGKRLGVAAVLHQRADDGIETALAQHIGG
ncbi:hypothetical protein KR99_16075 [Ralstonia solanacearum]|nr:hypothetical protein KR99_16075 [Ralstonia solanacearum]